MAIECPLSCGICTHLCNDTDTSCGAWATAGECEANPEAMLRLCPTSCGLCTPECSDLDKECTAWGAAGECNTNPEFMIRQCPVTCEACKSTCKDVQSDCPGWTADGECYKSESLRLCQTLAYTSRAAPVPSQPTAWCPRRITRLGRLVDLQTRASCTRSAPILAVRSLALPMQQSTPLAWQPAA